MLDRPDYRALLDTAIAEARQLHQDVAKALRQAFGL